ncbi:MAG: hypothetical protein ACOVOV_05305, partial [Dolichospermum sp.]
YTGSVTVSASPVCAGSSSILTASLTTNTVPAAPAASAYCASTHSSGCSGDNIARVVLTGTPGNSPTGLSKTTGTTCGTTSSA